MRAGDFRAAMKFPSGEDPAVGSASGKAAFDIWSVRRRIFPGHMFKQNFAILPVSMHPGLIERRRDRSRE
jgi:hypothetical protein